MDDDESDILFFRLQWIAYLEFSHSDEVGELTWEHVDVRLPRTDKLRGMVKAGVPHSLRPQLWMRLSGTVFFNVIFP